MAGVSPGLVQHHFAGKAALREAVDAHVLAVAAERFEDFPEADSATELQKVLGDRVTAISAIKHLRAALRGALDQRRRRGRPGAV